MAIKIEEKRKVTNFAELDGEAQDMVLDADIEKEDAIRLAGREKVTPEVKQEVKKPAEPKVESPESLSIAQLRILLEKKLSEQAEQAEEKVEPVKPPTKAPNGMVWVFNRGPEKFEWQYDAILYEIEGHDMMLFPARIGRHGRKRSIVSLDPFTNKAVYRLALENEPKFGVPLRVVNRIELMDRSIQDNLIGRGPGSTHSQVITVDGMADMLARRPSEYAELE